MSSEKWKMFITLLVFLVTAKKPLEIGNNFFLFFIIEKPSKFPFETYIVLHKKYKL